MKKRKYTDLMGQTVDFFVTATQGRRSKYFGSRRGVVVKVDWGIRKGFKGVRVRLALGKHLLVLPKELKLMNHGCGVLEGNEIRPLDAWLQYSK